MCPIIDVINDRSFAYQKGIELFRGGFNWNLQFRWYSVPSHVVKNRSSDPTAPIEYVRFLFRVKANVEMPCYGRRVV